VVFDICAFGVNINEKSEFPPAYLLYKQTLIVPGDKFLKVQALAYRLSTSTTIGSLDAKFFAAGVIIQVYGLLYDV